MIVNISHKTMESTGHNFDLESILLGGLVMFSIVEISFSIN